MTDKKGKIPPPATLEMLRLCLMKLLNVKRAPPCNIAAPQTATSKGGQDVLIVTKKKER